jgi:hypothetical protein
MNTPETDALEKTPLFLPRPQSPECGEALLLARKLERERNEAIQALRALYRCFEGRDVIAEDSDSLSAAKRILENARAMAQGAPETPEK